MNAGRFCRCEWAKECGTNSQDVNVKDGTMDPARKRNWLHKRKRIRLLPDNICTGVHRRWFIAASWVSRGNKRCCGPFRFKGGWKTEQAPPRLRFKERRKQTSLRIEPGAFFPFAQRTENGKWLTRYAPRVPFQIRSEFCIKILLKYYSRINNMIQKKTKIKAGLLKTLFQHCVVKRI